MKYVKFFPLLIPNACIYLWVKKFAVQNHLYLSTNFDIFMLSDLISLIIVTCHMILRLHVYRYGHDLQHGC